MIDTTKLKTKLEAELATLETELNGIGQKNPNNPADWQATPGNIDADSADRNEVADTIEEFEDNTAILKDLEIRYNNVKDALARITAGTYGTCEVCKKAIDPKRLEANPSATTCIEHTK
ncbi:MAG: TraR/DksA C4-type zinc finger protein [Candidatus Paceibacterota bacterium]|jgi:RNA polymerase-binding transcription factor DksA